MNVDIVRISNRWTLGQTLLHAPAEIARRCYADCFVSSKPIALGTKKLEQRTSAANSLAQTVKSTRTLAHYFIPSTASLPKGLSSHASFQPSQAGIVSEPSCEPLPQQR